MTRGYPLILILSLFAVLVIATGTASAAQSHVAGSCNSTDGQKVLAVTPTDDVINDDGIRLHTGSEVAIVFCSDGEAQQLGEYWNLTSSNAYAVESINNRSVTITFQSENEININESLERASAENELILSPVAVYASDGQIVDETIRFQSGGEADELETREATFTELKHGIRQNISTLRAVLNRESLSPEAVSNLSQSLQDINTQYTNIQNISGEMEAILYQQAVYPQTEQAVTAIRGINTEMGSIEQNVSSAAADVTDNVSSLRSEAQSTVRTNVGIGLVIGAVAGALLGAALPQRKGKATVYDQRYSSKNKYTRDVLKIPIIGGAALLVAGILITLMTDLAGVIV